MVSDKVRALLALAGKRNIDLATLYGVSKQSMNNKITNNRFSADDLIRIATFTGCKVAFVLPDGQNLFLDEDDLRTDKMPADDTAKPEQ
jgi:hypothetical protein